MSAICGLVGHNDVIVSVGSQRVLGNHVEVKHRCARCGETWTTTDRASFG